MCNLLTQCLVNRVNQTKLEQFTIAYITRHNVDKVYYVSMVSNNLTTNIF